MVALPLRVAKYPLDHPVCHLYGQADKSSFVREVGGWLVGDMTCRGKAEGKKDENGDEMPRRPSDHSWNSQSQDLAM